MMNQLKIRKKNNITEKIIEKEKKVLIIAILSVITLFIGTSYSLLINFDQTDDIITFQTGNLNMSVSGGDSISIANKLPESDQDGLNNATPISLTFTNTGTITVGSYDVKLITDQDKTSTLSDDYIKYAISTDGVSYSEPSILSETGNVIYTSSQLLANNSNTIYLKLWIDENAGTNALNKDYYGSISVDLHQKEKEGELLVDTFREVLTTRTSTTSIEDGITYISGAKDDNDPSTTNDVDYNYVWYSGKMWRITSVNSDGTMKLITDKAITSIAYGSDINFYTDEENTSYMYQWLNEDFLDTLYNYQNIIVTDSKWNATNSSSVTSTASEVSATEKNYITASSLKGESEDIEVLKVLDPPTPGGPTVSIETKLPETTMVTAPVGLLNSYEYYKSYENLGTDSTAYGSGYLNIGYVWRLLNPSSSAMWNVDYYGLARNYSPTYAYATRPSVNLKSTIVFSGGIGSKTDPYLIKGDKEEVEANTTLLSTRSSGEYVNFDGELYRIVGIENNTTKLNKVDYLRDESNTVLTRYLYLQNIYGASGNTQSDDYWDYYLNNTWYNSITSNYKSMMEKGTYYLGTVSTSAGNYKLAICNTASNTVSTKNCTKTSTTYTGYVGLPRYGEMFATQQGQGYSNSSTMWLITPYTTSRVWIVGIDSNADNNDPTRAYATRPSINLKSTVKITGGNGTESSPYEISL